jgi:hypothetical protein
MPRLGYNIDRWGRAVVYAAVFLLLLFGTHFLLDFSGRIQNFWLKLVIELLVVAAFSAGIAKFMSASPRSF